jgi:hypothetical protein
MIIQKPDPRILEFERKRKEPLPGMYDSIEPLSELEQQSIESIRSELLERYPELRYINEAACLSTS